MKVKNQEYIFKRPNELTYKVCNNTGFIVEKACRLPELKCYVENGMVMFWASVLGDDNINKIEAFQYLTPEVAMKMANALKIMAIQAFEESNK